MTELFKYFVQNGLSEESAKVIEPLVRFPICSVFTFYNDYGKKVGVVDFGMGKLEISSFSAWYINPFNRAKFDINEQKIIDKCLLDLRGMNNE